MNLDELSVQAEFPATVRVDRRLPHARRRAAGSAGNESDDLVELLDDEDPDDLTTVEPWKILVVDDDPSVHVATRLALARHVHRGRPVEVLSAHSGIEARAAFAREADISVALIDVVMETERAGLELARFVREELGNARVRLVIRTGQAGYMEESAVRRDYPVDDYCHKTELTSARLREILVAQFERY